MKEPPLAKVTIFPDGRDLPYIEVMKADGIEYDIYAAMPLYRERTLQSDMYEVVPTGISITPPPGYGVVIRSNPEKAENEKVIIWRSQARWRQCKLTKFL